MIPLEHPDRIQISFDDHRLVANAGLLLPVTLAQHLGVPRQSFLPAHCLKSNVTELRSHKVSWQIQPRNWR